jgi:hypothetical protein
MDSIGVKMRIPASAVISWIFQQVLAWHERPYERSAQEIRSLGVLHPVNGGNA